MDDETHLELSLKPEYLIKKNFNEKSALKTILSYYKNDPRSNESRCKLDG